MGVAGPRGRELVERLLASLAHRGPDDRGTWSSPELSLGHRRLSIIGLDAGGRQPMVSRSGRSLIVFNGEIYNYLELADRLEAEGRQPDRRYDTAVLLEALEAWGVEALARLNGMFAFAWYRPEERRLLLVRDRWGKKPLFWGRVRLDDGASTLVFSSELRTFTALPGGPPPSDPLGVARYLVYEGQPAERTVYRGVSKVLPASWLELELDGSPVASSSYWSLERRPRAVPLGEAAERFEERLARSLELRLRSDVPVGLFLSGGLDSSMLAATWRRIRPDGPLRTFTIGFDDPTYDERASARLMAEAVGAEHHEIVIRGEDLERELDAVWGHLSEPFADPSILPVSALCRLARQEVTVALGGDGGDELMAGYDPFRAWRPARALETLLPRRLLAWSGRRLERLLPADPGNMSARFKVHHFAQGFLHPPAERIQGWLAPFPVAEALAVMRPELAAQVDPEEVLEPTRRAFDAGRDVPPLYRQIDAWIGTYLESSILTKVDRASMMHSLEVRAPLLDPELADLLLSLPVELIYRRGKGKALLRHCAARRLPEALLGKRKKGLGVPQATWLRTVLRERFEACLAASRDGGWFQPQPIEALWRAHLGGGADHRRALWTFLFSFPFQRSA